MNITGTAGSWTSTTLDQRAINASGTGSLTCAAPNIFTINQNARTDLGMVTITAAATMVLTGLRFRQNITSGSRIGVYCYSNGANLTLNTDTYNATGNGWTNHYYYHATANGMTWASDNNIFEGASPNWYIFGNQYSSLAAYQAAVTPNDANSTAV